MFQKGEGCYLWDVENRKYLDFTAGIAVNALGHCDPEMAKLLGQQVTTIAKAYGIVQVRKVDKTSSRRLKFSFTPRTSTTTHGPAPFPNP
jgi:acetylornithine/succinyldiaminopimelate/putrescine aminotransferase